MFAPLTRQERPVMTRPFLPTPARPLRQRMIVDVRVIQVLLGHVKLDTTAL